MTFPFYIDEDTSTLLAIALRAQGVDALSAHEHGARGLEDEQQLEIAAGQGRAILSSNCKDFVRLSREWAVAERHHAGIIISYRQLDPDVIGPAITAINRVLAQYADVGIDEQLVVLDSYWPR